MGIKDLYKYLTSRHPECFKPIHFSSLAFEKVAIDMMNVLYMYKARDEKNWMENVVRFLLKLRNMYIHPICVFDGPTHPMKRDTVLKRRSDRERGRKRTDELKESLEHYTKTQEVQPNLKLLVDSKNEFVSRLSNQILVTQIEEYLEKQYRNYNIFFHTADVEAMKEIISALGIDVYTAPFDGEAYCSFLSAQGVVSAVLSNDSDVFFFGCKMVICKFNEDGGYSLSLNDVLNALEVNSTEFVDLCILCGTDYNASVRGIGFIRALNLIRKHHNLETIELLEPSIVDNVRKLTKPTPESLRTPKWSSQIKDFAHLNYLFFKYNISGLTAEDCKKKYTLIEFKEFGCNTEALSN